MHPWAAVFAIALLIVSTWAVLQHFYIRAIERSRDGWRALTYRALREERVDRADLMAAERDDWEDIA